MAPSSTAASKPGSRLKCVASARTGTVTESGRALAPDARRREVLVAGQRIGFTLRRSHRRTIGFLINDDGLRVTAPHWVSLANIDEAVQSKSRWILTKLQARQSRQQQAAMQRSCWEDGGQLPYLGRQIRLRTGADRTWFDGDSGCPQDGATLWLNVPCDASPERMRSVVQTWLQERARGVIGARLQHFLDSTGLRIAKWRLSGAATRWGSCTSRGNIMLNWRLIHFAPDIIDYVVAHELAHLREMNHSPAFWAEVGRLLPGYQPARDALRRHDPTSLPSFNRGTSRPA
nr:M48 family metallopeptidase [Pseudomonas sp.]